MYWQESEENERTVVPDDIVDVLYGIRCRALPVDHAHALSSEVSKILPWFADEETAGLHTIHVAESGNGWIRPEDPEALLHPSRRTKLMLRLPKQRVSDAERLSGATLNVAGHELNVEQATVKSLSPITTVFARYLVSPEGADETAFLRAARDLLAALGIQPKKMLCGIARTVATPEGALHTRSLMLTELTVEESVRLQQRGLGPGRKLGCGLFLPHKDIHEVRPVLD